MIVDFGKARRNLVESLISEGIIRSERVARAMMAVPREEFAMPEYVNSSYIDEPLPLFRGATISAPHMVAMMTELLELSPGMNVLEVGSGSGYHAAVCAEAMERRGVVHTVEYDFYIALFAAQNIERLGYHGIVNVHVGDGARGLPQHAPFDRILVTAAAPRLPQPLVEQLRDGGIIVIPIDEGWTQALYRIRKEDGRITREKITYVSFVKLRGEA